jgi:hypothetical protein
MSLIHTHTMRKWSSEQFEISKLNSLDACAQTRKCFRVRDSCLDVLQVQCSLSLLCSIPMPHYIHPFHLYHTSKCGQIFRTVQNCTCRMRKIFKALGSTTLIHTMWSATCSATCQYSTVLISTCQHLSALVSTCQHLSAHASIRLNIHMLN